MDVAGLKIINIYKPPSSRLLTISLPLFLSPCVYAGDFNCQHLQWGYIGNTSNGECLVEWAANNNLMLLHNPKGAASLLLGAGTPELIWTWLLQVLDHTTGSLTDVCSRSSLSLNINPHSSLLQNSWPQYQVIR